MIKTVEIRRLEDLLPLLTEQKHNEAIDRYRNPYLYRGLPNAEFGLITSIKRNCKHLAKNLEPSILRNFTKYAAIEDPTISKSVWRQMILGQHHGLPTRLLDWSQSPLIALNFAVTETNLAKMEARDCVVWRLDVAELRALLPQQYRDKQRNGKTDVFTVDMLSEEAPTLEKYDEDMQGNAMVVLEPPSIDPRIVNQYSFFTVVPLGMESIEDFLDRYTENTVKYVIKKEMRWRIRDMLDQLNISERMVYPGLDGLSTWLARYYYVKDHPENH